MAEIISLNLELLGDGAVIDVDRILGTSLGTLTRVVVIGLDRNGETIMKSSHGSREALWLIECGKHMLFEGDGQP